MADTGTQYPSADKLLQLAADEHGARVLVRWARRTAAADPSAVARAAEKILSHEGVFDLNAETDHAPRLAFRMVSLIPVSQPVHQVLACRLLSGLPGKNAKALLWERELKEIDRWPEDPLLIQRLAQLLAGEAKDQLLAFKVIDGLNYQPAGPLLGQVGISTRDIFREAQYLLQRLNATADPAAPAARPGIKAFIRASFLAGGFFNVDGYVCLRRFLLDPGLAAFAVGLVEKNRDHSSRYRFLDALATVGCREAMPEIRKAIQASLSSQVKQNGQMSLGSLFLLDETAGIEELESGVVPLKGGIYHEFMGTLRACSAAVRLRAAQYFQSRGWHLQAGLLGCVAAIPALMDDFENGNNHWKRMDAAAALLLLPGTDIEHLRVLLLNSVEKGIHFEPRSAARYLAALGDGNALMRQLYSTGLPPKLEIPDIIALTLSGDAGNPEMARHLFQLVPGVTIEGREELRTAAVVAIGLLRLPEAEAFLADIQKSSPFFSVRNMAAGFLENWGLLKDETCLMNLYQSRPGTGVNQDRMFRGEEKENVLRHFALPTRQQLYEGVLGRRTMSWGLPCSDILKALVNLGFSNECIPELVRVAAENPRSLEHLAPGIRIDENLIVERALSLPYPRGTYLLSSMAYWPDACLATELARSWLGERISRADENEAALPVLLRLAQRAALPRELIWQRAYAWLTCALDPALRAAAAAMAVAPDGHNITSVLEAAQGDSHTSVQAEGARVPRLFPDDIAQLCTSFLRSWLESATDEDVTREVVLSLYHLITGRQRSGQSLPM